MDDVGIRGEFLPPEIKDCGIDFKDLDDEIQDQINKDGYSGYEYTGKYFTIFYGGHFSFMENFHILACVLKFDEARQKIRQKTINIHIRYPGSLTTSSGTVKYNPTTTDWFVIFGLNNSTRRQGRMTGNIVPRIEINIYHGCLRPYLGTSRFIEIDGKNYPTNNQLQLIYPYSERPSQDRKSMLCQSKTYGSLLVIFLSQHGNTLDTTNFIIDIVKYNETEISHFKRIEAKLKRRLFSQQLYFNSTKNIFYIFNVGYSTQSVVAFDFDGEVLFKHALPNGVKIERVHHIENSLFMDQTTIPARILKISEDRVDIVVIRMNSEMLVNSPEKYTYSFINHLGNRFIEINQEVGQNRNYNKIISRLYNFHTGEELYENQRDSNRPFCWYNWNMRDIGYIDIRTRQEVVGNRIRQVDDKVLQFQKIQINSDITLKHLARMTCMESLSCEYMSQRLPNCLKRYVGIEM
eukprot:TCONS_00008065-protein